MLITLNCLFTLLPREKITDFGSTFFIENSLLKIETKQVAMISNEKMNINKRNYQFFKRKCLSNV